MKPASKISGVLTGIATGVLVGLALFVVWKFVMTAPASGSPTAGRPAKHGSGNYPGTPAVRLHAWLMIHPGHSIPELNLVADDSWASVSAGIEFDSEKSIFEGVRLLRAQGRQVFGAQVADALFNFAEDNDGALPEDLGELKPYLSSRCSDSMLSRYALLAQGYYDMVPENAPIVGETAGVDDEFDSVLSVSKRLLTKITTDRMGAEVQRAIHRFVEANRGELPRAAHMLNPYLKFPIAESELRKYFNKGGIEIFLKN